MKKHTHHTYKVILSALCLAAALCLGACTAKDNGPDTDGDTNAPKQTEHQDTTDTDPGKQEDSSDTEETSAEPKPPKTDFTEPDPALSETEEVTEPPVTEPAETEPVETEPAETEPTETELTETEPTETEPAETEPTETEPTETEPTETEPVDTEEPTLPGVAGTEGRFVSPEAETITLDADWTLSTGADGTHTLTVKVYLSCYELYSAAKPDSGVITVNGQDTVFSTDAIDHPANKKTRIPFTTYTCTLAPGTPYADVAVSWQMNGSYHGEKIPSLNAVGRILLPADTEA